MKTEHRTILAVAACFIFYLLYSQYLSTKYPDLHKPETSIVKKYEKDDYQRSEPTLGGDEATIGSRAQAAPANHNTNESVSDLDQQELRWHNDQLEVVFDQKSAGISSITLKDYKEDIHAEILKDLELNRSGTLVMQGSIDGLQSIGAHHGERISEDEIVFWRNDTRGWRIEQRYFLPSSGYGINWEVTWENTSDNSQDLIAHILMGQWANPPEEDQGGSFLPGMPVASSSILYRINNETDRLIEKDFCSGDSSSKYFSQANLSYMGFDQHYFLKSLIPQDNRMDLNISRNVRNGECWLQFVAKQKAGLVRSGEKITLKFSSWLGPKDAEFLQSYNSELISSIDFGWFDFLAEPLLMAMKFLEGFLGNWGLAIIVLTIFIKLLFYPLTRQAAVSMHKMKKLQPEMNRLKERFKDDPQRQQKELMAFMSKNKVNPMKGCLPILPQMPIFFAYYRVLSTSIDLRHAPFFGWIQDLSIADPFYITPLLLGVGMFAQQKLTPNAGMDKAQERIMLMLPVMFTVMMLTLPAGMVLYMLTNTIISIAQQQWLNRKLAATP